MMPPWLIRHAILFFDAVMPTPIGAPVIDAMPLFGATPCHYDA